MGLLDRLSRPAETESDDDDADAERDAGGTTNAHADSEQLAETDGSELAPRGQHRESEHDREGGFLLSRFGSGTRWTRSLRSWNTSTSSQSGRSRTDAASTGSEIPTDVAPPPEDLRENYRNYYLDFPFAQSALKTFDEMVVEPGWQIEATIDDETDEDMTEALDTWGHNCAIHAGEPGHDLLTILSQLPSKRRAKPAVFIEKVPTTSDPKAIAALQLLDPASISIRTRENQNLIVQPGDSVPAEHPTTDDGTPAAYVQYDDVLTRDFSRDPVPFTATDLVKLTYDPAEGSPWGRTIWPAIGEHISGLKRKINDRNASIRLAGHPHRIYSSETWTKAEAQEFSTAHEEGEVSAWDDDLDAEQRADGYASRVDFVNSETNVQVVEGQIADISDAVRDDLEAIFAVLPINKYLIAYADDINQHVVEPQANTDDRNVDKERRALETTFTGLFEQKADELANGSYAGEIDFRIEQSRDDNPLVREDFDAEKFATFVGAFSDFARSDADAVFPTELLYFASNMDRDAFETVLDDAAAMGMGLDEDDPSIQAAADEMGIGEDEDAESEGDEEDEAEEPGG